MAQELPRHSNPEPLSQSLAIDEAVLDSLTPEQWTAIQKYIFNRKGQKHPKLVDLRFAIDLVVMRFYVVLLVGQDRRNRDRANSASGLTKLGNRVAAVILLISLNIILSAFIVLILYLLKAALGIDIMPGHITQTLEQWSR